MVMILTYIVLFLVDSHGFNPLDAHVLKSIEQAACPVLMVIINVDVLSRLLPRRQKRAVSALTKLFTIGYNVADNILFGTDNSTPEFRRDWAVQWINRDNGIYDELDLPAETREKIKSHHADDAADVLDIFKKETGWSDKPADTGKSDVELLNEKRKKALTDSAGIPSKKVGRTTRQDTEETDDFDSAFAEGARKKEKQRSVRV